VKFSLDDVVVEEIAELVDVIYERLESMNLIVLSTISKSEKSKRVAVTPITSMSNEFTY
jgi:hypothetical protein